LHGKKAAAWAKSVTTKTSTAPSSRTRGRCWWLCQHWSAINFG